MKRKSLFVLVLAVFVVWNAFADSEDELNFSFGLGGFFTNDFGGGVSASLVGIEINSLKTPYLGGGGFLFFDMIFMEVDISFFVIKSEWEYYALGSGTAKDKVSCFGSDAGVYGKFPFKIGSHFTVFPLLGFYMRTIYVAEIGGKKESGANDLSALWFKLGGGVDYSISNKIYLRLEALYGLRLSNVFEDDMADYYHELGADVEKLFGHGLDIKLALGYKF
ncbi:MAG: hypothetical protein LBV17_02845 [Treponema sp.]|jgi:hypothetical protein|nr:hypothetical protein [Treponema sp.]